jgi:hypothetical protein
MTPEVTLWVVSLAGAVLFFAAGRLAGGRRREQPSPVLASVPPSPGPDLGLLRQELENAARKEAERAESLATELENAHTRLREMTAEDSRLATELSAARETAEQARQATAEARTARDELADRQTRFLRLETDLELARQEIHLWRERVADGEARLASAGNPETEMTLRQDLAIRSQQLDDAGRRLRILEDQNASLRQEVAASGGLVAERDRLQSENAEMRANGFATRRPTGTRPVALAGGGLTPGGVLQTLVEKVSRLGDVRCAVIADDLGLVVAAHGELGEEVAAVGALLARAGLQAQNVLPLRNVQRVTLEDDQGVVLSLRPLRTDGVKDVELSLITLAVGGGPDPRLVNKLIDEGPRSVLSS